MAKVDPETSARWNLINFLRAELFGLAGDSADGFGRGERPDVGQVDSEFQGGPPG